MRIHFPGMGQFIFFLSVISLSLAAAAPRAYCDLHSHMTRGVTGTTQKGHAEQQAKDAAYLERKAAAAKKGLDRQKALTATRGLPEQVPPLRRSSRLLEKNK